MFQENQYAAVRPEPFDFAQDTLIEGRKPVTAAIKPVLIFGYGNPSRGDDALGPLLLEALEEPVELTDIEILADFQLQIEHALDLANRKLVLFVDASVSCAGAFDFTELAPAKDNSYTTHTMSPASVMSVFQDIAKLPPPPCFLLSIKGEQFELGEGLTANAKDNLEQASRFVSQLMRHLDACHWRALTTHA